MNLQKEILPVTGINDFFRKLRDPNLQPVAYVWFGNGSPGSNLDLRQLGYQLDSLLFDNQNLLRQLSLWGHFVALEKVLSAPGKDYWDEKEPGIVRLSPRELQNLLNDPQFTADWTYIERNKSSVAKALKNLIVEIEQSLATYVL